MSERIISWKEIYGYEGLYKINEYGDVKSVERKAKKLHGDRTVKTRMLKPFIANGYRKVSLSKEGRLKQIYVHRLVASNFIRQPFNKEVVNHIDGDKLNNDFSNLEWCTYGENNKHARENNLWDIYGFNHYLSKFTEEDIPEIRKMASEGKPYIEIANKYGVRKETIGKVVRKEIYTSKEIPETKNPRNFGETNGRSVLNKRDVIEIRKLYKEGKSQREISRMFGVGRTSIHLIVTKQRWKHIS